MILTLEEIAGIMYHSDLFLCFINLKFILGLCGEAVSVFWGSCCAWQWSLWSWFNSVISCVRILHLQGESHKKCTRYLVTKSKDCRASQVCRDRDECKKRNCRSHAGKHVLQLGKVNPCNQKLVVKSLCIVRWRRGFKGLAGYCANWLDARTVLSNVLHE